MCNNLHKNKKSKVVKARSNNNGPDEKKTRLENVDQSALSFLETCKSVVKLNVNNSLKSIDKPALDNVEDTNKLGNIFLCFCIIKEKQLKVSIPKIRLWFRIFVKFYLTTLIRYKTG